MPSLPNNDLTRDSGKAALMSHDTRKSSTCITGMTSTTQLRMVLRFLVLIRHQVIYIQNSKFDGPYHQSGSVHAISAVAVGE